MKKIFIILFLVFNYCVYSQKEANIWYFGNYAGLDFNSGTPIVLTNSAMSTQGGCGTISDQNGNLLFYSDGNTVWNKNNLIMMNGTGLGATFSTSQSGLTVPMPGNDSLYYIFINLGPGPNRGLKYSIVNMNLDNGKGAVIIKTVSINNTNNITQTLTAVRHSNNKDIWIITSGWYANTFYAYLLTNSGINTTPVISNSGLTLMGNGGYSKTSPDGKKIALGCNTQSEILDFNNATGAVSNAITLTYNSTTIGGYGVEFSPDCSKLYISGWQYLNQWGIYQFDISTNDPNKIDSLSYLVYNIPYFTSKTQKALQISTDGKIYVAIDGSYYLGIINKPNIAGISCNYQDSGIYLKGEISESGLPVFMQSYFFIPEFLSQNLCYGDITIFTITDTSKIDSVKWNFGDIASGINNISKSKTPTHKYSDTGTYVVALYIYHQNLLDSNSRIIKISPYPTAKYIIADSIQCLIGNKVYFTNQSNICCGNMSYKWIFGDSTNSYDTNTHHSYNYPDTFKVKLIALSDYGCTDTFTGNVYIEPLPKMDFSINDSTQCLGNNNFSIKNLTNTYGVNPYSWLWYFGDKSSYNGINPPFHSYSAPDTYQVKLITNLGNGCIDSVTKNVYVYPMPKAIFTTKDTAQCLNGNNFVYTNNTTLGYGTFTNVWKFGDNFTSTQASPSHTYLSPGKDTVTLIAISNEGCRDSFIKIIYVESEPVSNFNINDSSQCMIGNNFNFTNQSTISSGSIIEIYNWYFGDGIDSTDANTKHSYTTHDTFQVKLVVTSNYGCKDSITKNVYVYPMPEADYLIWDSSQCLPRNGFGFVNTSNISWGNMNYLWKFGDGDTSSSLNPVHHYNISGSFQVTLITSSAFGCIDSIKKRTYVIVHPRPNAAFNIVDSAQCLSGNSFSDSNTSSILSGSFTQIWSFGDGDTTSSFNASHSYKNADTFYTKLLIISDWLCKDSIIKAVIVYPMPKTDFNIKDTLQCLSGNNFVFSDNSTISSGIISSYLWNFGDGKTSTAQNTNHNYMNYGAFTVTLYSTSTFGCSDSNSKKIYVLPMPIVNFTINDSSQCLNGNLFVFNDTSTKVHTDHWSFGDNDTALSFNPKHNYLIDSTYKVKLVITSASGCSDSITKSVYVNSMPKTDFIIKDTAQCLSGNSFKYKDSTYIKSGSIKNYLWNFGDGKTANKQDTNHSYLISDTFTVSLRTISAFGCSDSSNKKIYVLPMPLVNFAINDSTQCQKGNLFNFFDTIHGIFKNHWEYGDGNSSDSFSPIYTYTKAGNFQVKLISSSVFGCSDSLVKNIHILQTPQGDFTINSKDTQVVCGNNFIFINKSTLILPDVLTYKWDFGDGDTSSSTNTSHKYLKTGTFHVMLIAKNLEGCIDPVVKDVILLACSITVDFSFSNGCVGDTVLFINSSKISGDTFLNFLWDFGDSIHTIIKTNPRHIYYKPGIFIVGLTALTNSGYKDTTYKNITIYPNPTISLDSSGATTFYMGNSVIFNVVNGQFDSLILWSNGRRGDSDTFYKTGNYKVTVIDYNGCRDSMYINIIAQTIPELTIMNVITPNGDGINDYWKISNADAYGKLKVRIFNRWGDELYSSSDYKNDWAGKYNGKDLPEGTYYYLIETEKGDLYKGPINILR